MLEVKQSSEYYFRVKEAGTDWEKFTVFNPKGKDATQIIQEAAYLYFFGQGGWQEAWPLTFELKTLKGASIGNASVFVVSGDPQFEVNLLTAPKVFKYRFEEKEVEPEEKWEEIPKPVFVVSFLITFLSLYLLWWK